MSTIEIVNYFVKEHGTVFLLAMTLIEVVPVKINPWTWIFKWIGKAANGKITEDIAEIKSDVTKLKEKQEYQEAMVSRYRIIRAADEITNGMSLSEDHISQLEEDINIYNLYCHNHADYENHKGQKSKAIVEAYEERISHV